MTYVDGFIVAVPTAQKERYLEVSETFATLFKSYGALSVVECWGNDVPDGEITSFPMAVKCEKDETVVFSWIVWPSKAARDEGHKAFEGDPALATMSADMPFDGKRMIMGGFEMMLER